MKTNDSKKEMMDQVKMDMYFSLFHHNNLRELLKETKDWFISFLYDEYSFVRIDIISKELSSRKCFIDFFKENALILNDFILDLYLELEQGLELHNKAKRAYNLNVVDINNLLPDRNLSNLVQYYNMILESFDLPKIKFIKFLFSDARDLGAMFYNANVLLENNKFFIDYILNYDDIEAVSNDTDFIYSLNYYKKTIPTLLEDRDVLSKINAVINANLENSNKKFRNENKKWQKKLAKKLGEV